MAALIYTIQQVGYQLSISPISWPYLSFLSTHSGVLTYNPNLHPHLADRKSWINGALFPLFCLVYDLHSELRTQKVFIESLVTNLYTQSIC